MPYGKVETVTNPLPNVRLIEIDGSNWRAVAAVTTRPDQDRFVAPVTYYLCLAHYGDTWHSLAIVADESIVGHLMRAVDDEDGSIWLGGLVVDAAAQGAGIGRAAVIAFIESCIADGRLNVALSYSPDNAVARTLYAAIGFVETGEMEDDEIVARYQRDNLPAP